MKSSTCLTVWGMYSKCFGLLKLVHLFVLLAVTLLGFGPLIGIWMPVRAELSNTSPCAAMHMQIHKGVFNHTHPFLKKAALVRQGHEPLTFSQMDMQISFDPEL